MALYNRQSDPGLYVPWGVWANAHELSAHNGNLERTGTDCIVIGMPSRHDMGYLCLLFTIPFQVVIRRVITYDSDLRHRPGQLVDMGIFNPNPRDKPRITA